MGAADVAWPIPLVRQKPLFTGQIGVPGTDSHRGLRTSVNGVVFYVDPNAPGVSDQRDGTDPEGPLATVTKALTLVRPYAGDVISVMANNAWRYGNPTHGLTTPVREQVVVNTPGIRIVGLNPSPNGVVWRNHTDGGVCISIHALDVVVEGFLFTEGAGVVGCVGVQATYGGGLTGDNPVIRHCMFDGILKGIVLDFSWYGQIHGCRFWEVEEEAIYRDPAVQAPAYVNIHDNIFHDCGVAMSLAAAGMCHIYRNSIYNASARAGIAATDQGIFTTGGGENQVFDNWFSCILPAGAPGDWNDFCTGSPSDSWLGNHCLNGLAVGNPT